MLLTWEQIVEREHRRVLTEASSRHRRAPELRHKEFRDVLVMVEHNLQQRRDPLLARLRERLQQVR